MVALMNSIWSNSLHCTCTFALDLLPQWAMCNYSGFLIHRNEVGETTLLRISSLCRDWDISHPTCQYYFLNALNPLVCSQILRRYTVRLAECGGASYRTAMTVLPLEKKLFFRLYHTVWYTLLDELPSKVCVYLKWGDRFTYFRLELINSIIRFQPKICALVSEQASTIVNHHFSSTAHYAMGFISFAPTSVACLYN